MIIEMYADLICPWCWIGKQRLERALQHFADQQFKLIWQPFQLHPDWPSEGYAWESFLQLRALSPNVFKHITDVGLSEGIEFDFPAIARVPNTAAAHQLIVHSAQTGFGWRMYEHLARAYFFQHKNLSNPEVLLEVAAGIGIPQTQLRAALQNLQHKATVEQSQTRAAQLGIHGVPFLVFNNRLGLSGAQPVETLIRAIEQGQLVNP
jgi:predicted DsbA family dithiol-disulfide isomerase